jgi:hypothetical protein
MAKLSARCGAITVPGLRSWHNVPPGAMASARPARLSYDLFSLMQITLATIFVIGVPFAMFFRLIMYHFYIRGGFFGDAGMIASLMWRTTIDLPMPPSVELPAGTLGHSFFYHHVAPVLWLFSAASYALPFSMPQYFACFVGLSHGLLALAVFWLLVQNHDARRGWRLAIAALTSCAFAFNGLALDIVRWPHFETFAAACLLLVFVALVLERWMVATITFLFAVATREDVGLHAFSFLFVWIALNWFRGLPWRKSRPLIGFAVAGLCCSVAALIFQHWFFPTESSFARIYLGNPPFAHLTFKLLGARLCGWLVIHAAILLPIVVTFAWAARTRDPYPLGGFLACVPWALLQFLAAFRLAGMMVGYYAYPFLAALAWPALADVIQDRRSPALVPQRFRTTSILLCVTAASLLPVGRPWNPGLINLPEAFVEQPSARQQHATDLAIAAIANARPELGKLLVAESVAALAPFSFEHNEIAGWDRGEQPNTVIYFADGFDVARLGSVPGLSWHYAIPGTMLRISTDRPCLTSRKLGIPLSELQANVSMPAASH